MCTTSVVVTFATLCIDTKAMFPIMLWCLASSFASIWCSWRAPKVCVVKCYLILGCPSNWSSHYLGLQDAVVSLTDSLLAITERVVQATTRATTLQCGACHRDRPKEEHRRQQHQRGPPWLPPPPLPSSPSLPPHTTLPDRSVCFTLAPCLLHSGCVGAMLCLFVISFYSVVQFFLLMISYCSVKF